MTRGRNLTPPILAVALLIALAPVITACGKSGPPRPPEGEESRFTFPRFQPAQDTSPPLFGRPAAAAPAPEAETEGERQRRAGAREELERRRPSPFMRRPDFDPFTEGFDSFGTFSTSPK